MTSGTNANMTTSGATASSVRTLRPKVDSTSQEPSTSFGRASTSSYVVSNLTDSSANAGNTCWGSLQEGPIDGGALGEYVTDHKVWCALTLSDISSVSEVRMRSNPATTVNIATPNTFPSSFTIEVADSLGNWTTVLTETNYTYQGAQGDEQIFEFNEVQNVKYVRFSTNKLKYDGSAYSLMIADMAAYGTVGGTALRTVDLVAQTINLVSLPSYEDEYITMPVPRSTYTMQKTSIPASYSDYKVELIWSSDPGVISVPDGKIRRSATETKGVYLRFRVTSPDGAESAETKNLLVPIYKTYKAPQMSQEEIDKIKDEYEHMKYGFFDHYVKGTNAVNSYYMSTYSNGLAVVDVDDLTNDFDAVQFGKDMDEFGVEYVIFTAWHAGARTIFPSMANKRWRDDRLSPVAGDAKSYSDRDMVEDLLNELDKYDIKLILYAHTSDAVDFTTGERYLTLGHNTSTDAVGVVKDQWNEYILEVYQEMCERYGTRLYGIWNDGTLTYIRSYKSSSSSSYEDPAPGIERMTKFKEVCKLYNPAIILTANTTWDWWGQAGNNYQWPLDNKPRPDWDYAIDYRAAESQWGYFQDMETELSLTGLQMAHIIGINWWTQFPQSFKHEDLVLSGFPVAKRLPNDTEYVRFLIGSAASSEQGGFAASAGNFVGKADTMVTSGDIWEYGLRNFLVNINNKYLKPVSESIFGTNIGKAYPAKIGPNYTVTSVGPLGGEPGATPARMVDQGWGVSTESRDGAYVYLHVMYPAKAYPSQATSTDTIEIADTADGTTLRSDAVILNFDGTITEGVALNKTEDGYEVVLPSGTDWDPIDTIIKAERTNTDAILLEVAEKEVTTTSGDGEAAGSAYIAEVTVEATKASIEVADLFYSDYATANIYSDAAFSQDEDEAIEIAGGTSEHIYVLVTSEDGSVKTYYDVTVNRPVDKSALQSLYDNYKDNTQANYTDESWADLQTKLSEADTVLQNSGATQAEVDSAKNALQDAIDALEEKPEPTDKTLLQSLYDAHKDDVQGNYTDDSWNDFEDALTEAKDLLDNTSATQVEIDAAKDALNNAISALTLKVDKTALQSLYDSNKAKQQGNYTNDTWATFTDALQHAKAILDNGNVTQSQINASKSYLDSAIAGLKEEGGSTPGTGQVDKLALTSLYVDHEDDTQANYTDDTWATFQNALNAAKAIIDDANATQAQVDAAKKALQDALNGLLIDPNKSTGYAGQSKTYTKGNDDLVVTIQADFSKFVRLTLSGAVVDTANYSVASGSTIITFKKEYLNTFKAGTYVFQAEFTDGVAPVSVTIKNAGTSSSASSSSPDTGDHAESTLYLIICLLTLLAIGGIAYLKKMGFIRFGSRK
ncbi:MAG: FIVAR domain-containing protein [Lachnospiraceae bacterium]|jgi:hypothetical protein|nr:FIVAR domain-containing protein [Lachnospiraceae bacterium]